MVKDYFNVEVQLWFLVYTIVWHGNIKCQLKSNTNIATATSGDIQWLKKLKCYRLELVMSIKEIFNVQKEIFYKLIYKFAKQI